MREHGTRGASTRAKHTAAYLIASASTDLDLTVGAGELEEPPTLRRTCAPKDARVARTPNRRGGSMLGMRACAGETGAQWMCDGRERGQRAGAHLVTPVSDKLRIYEG